MLLALLRVPTSDFLENRRVKLQSVGTVDLHQPRLPAGERHLCRGGKRRVKEDISFEADASPGGVLELL